MPDLTIASAIPRTSSALTLQPNLFQVFHPMGGVSARPLDTELSCASTAALSDNAKTIKINNLLFISVGPLSVAIKCTHSYQNIVWDGSTRFDNPGLRF